MRNSKQREEILSFLRSKRAHYSAVQIYDAIRQTVPNISLGTVYRNLGKLAESGEIITVVLDNESVYYDGFVAPHSHFLCRKCKEIYDVEAESDKKHVEEQGFTVENVRIVYYGLCKNCSKNN